MQTSYKPKNIVESQELAQLEKRFKLEDYKDMKIRKFEDLSNYPCADLEVIQKFMGDEQAAGIVSYILMKQFKDFEVHMNQNICIEFALDIVTAYPGMKPTDVQLMNRMAIIGRLGELYSGIRVDRYFDSKDERGKKKGYITRYLELKAEYIEKRHCEIKKQIEKQNKESVLPTEKYLELKKQFDEKNNISKLRSLNIQSFWAYCTIKGLPYITVLRKAYETYRNDYVTCAERKIMTFRQYFNLRRSQFIRRINKTDKDVNFKGADLRVPMGYYEKLAKEKTRMK